MTVAFNENNQMVTRTRPHPTGKNEITGRKAAGRKTGLMRQSRRRIKP
ncbi:MULTISPECIES: hypothetical protein [unclassified Azospirillum]|nr:MULTISPECIES: hypothetical protein [unclassified Azospirillum]